MRPNRSSKAGVRRVDMEGRAGVTVEMDPEQGATTTGRGGRGIATATAQAPDVGASRAEPTPAAAAAAPGRAAEDQILQNGAPRTQAPTGATQTLRNPTLRVTARAGSNPQRTTRTGVSTIQSPPTSGGKLLKPTCPEAIHPPPSPQVLIWSIHPIRISF